MKEQLEELREMLHDLPASAPTTDRVAGIEKTIVEFRKDDKGESSVAEMLAYQLQAEDHQAIRNELKEYGDLCIIHEDADVPMLMLNPSNP